MSHILSYGIYIPRYYAENILFSPGRPRSGQCSVGFSDEDTLTMSVAAMDKAMKHAKNKVTKNELDGIIFASTRPVFQNRYHASFLASLYGLRQGIRALDLTGTSRSGTDAIMLANEWIHAGICKNVMVAASDMLFPPIGEEATQACGHAAVAFILCASGGVAEIISAQSFSDFYSDEFSYKHEKIKPDTRFTREYGFMNCLHGVMESVCPVAGNYNAVIMNSPWARQAGRIFFKAGFSEKQLLRDTIQPLTGNTGVCHALLQLTAAIEKCDSILLMDHFNGMNVLAVSVKARVKSPEPKAPLRPLASYHDYLALRKAGHYDSVMYHPVDMFSSDAMNFRERESLLYLKGYTCTACKTIYLIPSAACKKCGQPEFTRQPISPAGTVYTLTREYYFPHPFPPITMVVLDLDGGGRITVQATDDLYDDEKNKIQIGSRMKLSLRKMLINGTKPDYFWKAVRL